MRTQAFVLILGVACAFTAVHVRGSGEEPTVEAEPTPLAQEAKVAKKIVKKIDPTLNPEYVSLLKKHAVERTSFFDAQAKARQDLKQKQTQETDDLVQTHRHARQVFGESTHTRDERAAFYRNQRAEMSGLRSKHDAELSTMLANQRKDQEAFHLRQHQENATLLRELSQAH